MVIIKRIERCTSCGTLLDVQLSEAMKYQPLNEGECSRYDSWYDATTLEITQAEMDVRGLGTFVSFSFCSLDCLKAWVKKEGWIKERLWTPRCALCRRENVDTVLSVVWKEDEKRFESVSICLDCNKRKRAELTCPKCGTGEHREKGLDVRIGIVYCLQCGSHFSVFPFVTETWL